MPARTARTPVTVSVAKARAIWIAAQRLNTETPFGSGPSAVEAAIAHLGYVQIDTISVIERCHHHILYNRIPCYRRADLVHAQSEAKTVFEYWTHALSYVPVTDFPHFTAAMKQHRRDPSSWYGGVPARDMSKMLRRVRDEGPLAMSDITDDKPVDKNHPWASRKPSKRVLEAGFYNGRLAIARRNGMLKTYDLIERHFGWDRLPKPASATSTNRYLLERALRAQGLISLESVCHLNPKSKPAIAALIEREAKARRLVPVRIDGAEQHKFWARPETLAEDAPHAALTHILSPFDPLIIQRKRTEALFGYSHLFEAYVPKAKRKLGYFTLPVLCGDEIVAALDLKADRQEKSLLIQAWHWVGRGESPTHRQSIEAALDRFSTFQFGD